MSHVKKLAAVASVAGALVIAPGASAAPPTSASAQPAATGRLHLQCGRRRHDLYRVLPGGHVSEPQFELVCGSGADAFIIHDNGHLDRAATRWYDGDGNLTRRVLHDQSTGSYWSNPLSGKIVTYNQNDKITDDLLVPGDFASARETQTGMNNYFDPVTHRKVLQSTGRTVFGPDGSLESVSGQQLVRRHVRERRHVGARPRLRGAGVAGRMRGTMTPWPGPS